MALGNARQQREDMVLWLALQVMMTDDVALADDALQERLIILQDRIENMMRARLGLPDRDAARGKPKRDNRDECDDGAPEETGHPKKGLTA